MRHNAAVSPDVVLALLDEVDRLDLLSRDSAAWLDLMRSTAEMRRRKLDALRAILDRRPALNDGLREAYAAWSAEVYAMDAMDAVGEESDE